MNKNNMRKEAMMNMNMMTRARDDAYHGAPEPEPAPVTTIYANSNTRKVKVKVTMLSFLLCITLLHTCTHTADGFQTSSSLRNNAANVHVRTTTYPIATRTRIDGSSVSSIHRGKKVKMNMNVAMDESADGGSENNYGNNGNRNRIRNLKKASQKVIGKTTAKLAAFRLWMKQQKAKTLTTALMCFAALLSVQHGDNLGHETVGGMGVGTEMVGMTTSNANAKSLLSATRGGSSGRGSISSTSPTTAIQNFLNRGGASTELESTPITLSPDFAPVEAEVEAAAPATTTSAAEGTQMMEKTGKTFAQALADLQSYMAGPKSDTLLLLLATSLITPVCKQLGISTILGFLAAGMALGPNALGLISGIHTTETLAELGIVFFLFEMGIELSVERLMSMKKDVFGLGLSQFGLTAVAIALAGRLWNLPANALVVLGGGLALSSSAFVLQLLKDNNQLATRFGKASFGVLLFQDLAVVPLLVVTPILAGGGQGLASALGSAFVKAAMALTSIAFAGRVVLNPLFKLVAQSNSQEAFLGVVLLTVLSMSFMTEGLGLSNTLGAFLAGVLLSETKYRYQIEADIAPFRGILLGLFFVTVGFEIDFNLIASNLPLVSSLVAGILFIKTSVLTLLSRAFGLSLSTSLQTGLILSQGGEFAFVAFGLARSLGILDPATTKLMLTSVALTMAVTPSLASIGGNIAKKLEEDSDFTHYLGQDSDANEIKESENFVVVVGYGQVGRLVCNLLDKKLYKYVGLEINPNKAIQARNQGLPVFYGDIGRPEVAEAFGIEKANAIIVTISDRDLTNRAVISLRRQYPDKKIFARAVNADHAERLQKNLDVIAMVPVVPEDSILLTLPFGGAVLRSLGAAQEEVNAILERTRKEVLEARTSPDDDRNMVLAQLGIVDVKEPEQEKALEQTSPSDKPVPESGGEGDADSSTKAKESESSIVTAEVIKSPMVAEVIESMKEPAAPAKVDADEGGDTSSMSTTEPDTDVGDQEKNQGQGDVDSELKAKV